MKKREMAKPEQDTADQPGRGRVQNLVTAGLTLLAVCLCYLVARPFVTALAWTLALAIVAAPLHRWIAKWIRHRGSAAGVAVVVVAVLLLAPFGLLAPRVVNEAVTGFNSIESQVNSGAWQKGLDRHPWIKSSWQWVQQRVNLADTIQRFGSELTSFGSSLVRGSFIGLLQLAMIFFLLFYFFRDRDEALDSIRSLLPLSNMEADMVFVAVRDTIYATVYGKVAAAIMQGVLGGIIFWALGLTGAWFWAIVMAVVSILPVLGPSVVWLPAMVFLLLNGHWVKAMILVIWGLLIIASIENFVYPILVRHRLRLHTATVFVAMIGGLFVFGPAGFFLGPVILAVTMTLLEICRHRFSSQPQQSGDENGTD